MEYIVLPLKIPGPVIFQQIENIKLLYIHRPKWEDIQSSIESNNSCPLRIYNLKYTYRCELQYTNSNKHQQKNKKETVQPFSLLWSWTVFNLHIHISIIVKHKSECLWGDGRRVCLKEDILSINFT